MGHRIHPLYHGATPVVWQMTEYGLLVSYEYWLSTFEPGTYYSRWRNAKRAVVILLTTKTGAAHKPLGEASQLKRDCNIVEHKGYDKELYCVHHPSLMSAKSGNKTRRSHLMGFNCSHCWLQFTHYK